MVSQNREKKKFARYTITMKDEFSAHLPPDVFTVMQNRGTEAPGTSPLLHEDRSGIFRCRACNTPLFESGAKYDSGSGWPSFVRPIEGVVGTSEDTTHGMRRIEVHCNTCGGHLGHVFPDGPQDRGGTRYCINGLSLSFDPKE